jgi:hypothetical protein
MSYGGVAPAGFAETSLASECDHLAGLIRNGSQAMKFNLIRLADHMILATFNLDEAYIWAFTHEKLDDSFLERALLC